MFNIIDKLTSYFYCDKQKMNLTQKEIMVLDKVLLTAINEYNVPVVKFLLEHGAHCDILEFINNVGDGDYQNYNEILRLLIEHGVDVDVIVFGEITMLMYAAKKGNVKCVKLLLEHGFDVNAIDCWHRSALYLAFEGRHIECAKLLLEHGADVNAKSVDGQTSLHKAILHNCVEHVKLLLEHGADVDVKTITLAIEHEQFDIAQLLLEHMKQQKINQNNKN